MPLIGLFSGIASTLRFRMFLAVLSLVRQFDQPPVDEISWKPFWVWANGVKAMQKREQCVGQLSVRERGR